MSGCALTSVRQRMRYHVLAGDGASAVVGAAPWNVDDTRPLVARTQEHLVPEAAPRTLDHFLPEAFDRVDPRPDSTFYDFPRYVVHIDDGAIAAVGVLAARIAEPGATVLDLMSSYRSHLPPDLEPRAVVGIGLNAEEMAANPQLTRWAVHDLNAEPALPEPDATYDL